jgi:MFS family permease
MSTLDSRSFTAPSPPNVPTGPWSSACFRWYFIGTVASWLGTAMAPVALTFEVLDLSGSSADLGLAVAARSLPMLVFLLVGGAVADRLPRRQLLSIANLGAAITQGILAVLLMCGSASLGMVIVLQLLNGAISAFTIPTATGIVPELVDAASSRRANAQLSGAQNASNIIGGTLAGFVVVGAGGEWAIAVDALSFLIAAVCISRLRVSGRRPPQAGLLTEFRVGWTLFFSTTWVWVGSLAASVTNFFHAGFWYVLGPSRAEQTSGPEVWGLILTTRACGLLCISLIMYRVRVTYLLRFGHMGLALGAAPLIAVGLSADVALIGAAAFISGLGIGAVGIAWSTSIQTKIPADAISRVSAIDHLGAYIAVPIGQLAAGPLAVAAGASTAEVLGGAIFAIVALLPLAAPSVRAVRHDS